jgi:hypothetical protein
MNLPSAAIWTPITGSTILPVRRVPRTPRISTDLKYPVLFASRTLYNGRDKTFFMFNAEYLPAEAAPVRDVRRSKSRTWVNGDFSGFTDSNGDLYPVYDVNTAIRREQLCPLRCSRPRTPEVNDLRQRAGIQLRARPTASIRLRSRFVNMAIADTMTPTPNAIAGDAALGKHLG